jgi:hypothetical protein
VRVGRAMVQGTVAVMMVLHGPDGGELHVAPGALTMLHVPVEPLKNVGAVIYVAGYQWNVRESVSQVLAMLGHATA